MPLLTLTSTQQLPWAAVEAECDLGSTISDAAAVTIAAAWQSPGPIPRPSWGDQTVRPLSELTNVARAQWPARGLPPQVTHDEHRHCPGAVSWLDRDYYNWRYDADDEDGGGEDDIDVQNENGDDNPLHDGDDRWLLVHGCTQPQHHTRRDHRVPATNPNGENESDGDTDADADARRGERRRLIALNKAADAATIVRREWLTAFSHRKTSPKDAAVFLLTGLAHRDPAWPDLATNGLRSLRATLDVTDTYPYNPQALTDLATTAGRAAHLHLCAVLWAYDTHIQRDSWRDPLDHQRRYLTQLQAWGYPVAEVEQIITADTTPEAAYNAITT